MFHKVHLCFTWLCSFPEARAEISGPPEKYLKPGSGLKLQCSVIQSTELPLYVFWYHNNRMVNYDVDRGINVTTELTTKTSTLTITNADTRHTGNYSCVPSSAQPASTYVHILNGKFMTRIFLEIVFQTKRELFTVHPVRSF